MSGSDLPTFARPSGTKTLANKRNRNLNGEPKIRDLIKDPVTRALMSRDGVRTTDLMALIGNARRGLRQRHPRELRG